MTIKMWNRNFKFFEIENEYELNRFIFFLIVYFHCNDDLANRMHKDIYNSHQDDQYMLRDFHKVFVVDMHRLLFDEQD